ncbi:peptide ABC transporter substrate-binding protein [Risungbinella massiliensis]|uniref:peptide ABC transporter substrate-binding protein n=1 Tax=Risungbinella massiliensis TaxID=1329796 RepID=UPI00164E64E2|nr:peptide ABC transporter substrate-binding protein [Risungbinella massiliensis]
MRPSDAEDLSEVKLYEPPPRTNLILLSPEAFTQLDSSRTMQQSTMNLLNQIQEGLVRMNEKQEIVPALASSYVADAQNKVFTFTIRQEAKWSDGQPVKAADFQYAWLRALRPDSEFPYPNLFYAIHNAEAYKTGKVNETQVGIKVLNDHTLQVTLNRSFPDFPQLLIQTPYFPMRKDIVDAYQESYGTDASTLVYSGPFRLQAFSAESSSLIPNEFYWDKGNVKLKDLRINVEQNTAKHEDLYKNDKVDVIKVGGELYKSSQLNPELVKVNGNQISYLQLNLNKEIFSNSNVLKAISTTLDKQGLSKLANTQTILTDRVLSTFTQPNNSDVLSMLDKGLLELGKRKSDIELTLLVEDNLIQKNLAQNVKNQFLQKLKINTKIVELNLDKQKREEYKGTYDLSLTSWVIYDVMDFLDKWHSKSPYNTSNYSNPKFDQLLDQAKNNPTDAAHQRALLEQAEQVLLQEDAATIPLFFFGSSWLQKPRVKGVVYHPAGPEYTLKWATLIPLKTNP